MEKNPRLRIEIDKEMAYRFFLYTVHHFKDWPWTRTGLLTDIDKDLADFELPSTKKLFDKNFDFTGNKKTIELHEKLWKENMDKIKSVRNSLLKCRKYLEFSIKKVPELTKTQWGFKEIGYFPVIYKGGSQIQGNIFFGIDYPKNWLKEKNLVMNIGVHEMIHANVDESSQRLANQGVDHVPREIVIIHLTSSIFKLLNKKFGLGLGEQRYHEMFSDLEKHREKISKIIKGKKYEWAVKHVDKFLKNI